MNELDSYLRGTDRSEGKRTPFFSGRKEELVRFGDALDFVAEEQVGGQTYVCQGAPGAGKSALAEECAVLVAERTGGLPPRSPPSPEAVMRAGERERSSITRWAVVRASPNRLDSIEGLIGAIDGALRAGERGRGRVGPALGEAARGLSERGGGAGGIAIAIGPRPPRELDVQSRFEARKEAWQGAVVVVLVDEAQNIPMSDRTRAIVQCLHAGEHGSRILLACFGLSDTVHTLRRLGISRLGTRRRHDLSALSAREAAASIRAAFDAFGVHGSPAERARWVDALAGVSQGWPQHLRNVTREALLELNAHSMELSRSSLERAVARGEDAKRAYYEDRLEGVGRWLPAYRRLAARLEDDGGASLTDEELEAAIGPELRKRNTSYEAFLEEAIHAGVLSWSRGGYAIPIPSFALHIRAAPRPARGRSMTCPVRPHDGLARVRAEPMVPIRLATCGRELSNEMLCGGAHLRTLAIRSLRRVTGERFR